MIVSISVLGAVVTVFSLVRLVSNFPLKFLPSLCFTRVRLKTHRWWIGDSAKVFTRTHRLFHCVRHGFAWFILKCQERHVLQTVLHTRVTEDTPLVDWQL